MLGQENHPHSSSVSTKSVRPLNIQSIHEKMFSTRGGVFSLPISLLRFSVRQLLSILWLFMFIVDTFDAFLNGRALKTQPKLSVCNDGECQRSLQTSSCGSHQPRMSKIPIKKSKGCSFGGTLGSLLADDEKRQIPDLDSEARQITLDLKRYPASLAQNIERNRRRNTSSGGSSAVSSAIGRATFSKELEWRMKAFELSGTLLTPIQRKRMESEEARSRRLEDDRIWLKPQQ
ncbi:hypothetical protein BDR26DRAFT_859940, partial [Obelidium mucronatum]